MMRVTVGAVVCLALAGCRDGGGGAAADTDTGTQSDTATATETQGETESGTDTGELEDAPLGVGRMGMRRLTRVEFDNTVADLLGDDTRPGTQFLPEDKKTPFDNEFATQNPSRVLVEGAETIASDLAEALVADPPRRDLVVGCTPAGQQDADCMESFVRTFGRRALRRALADDEVADFVALGLDFADRGGDFDDGVEQVVRTLLQDAEFLYRIELGTETADPGVFRLSGYEVATRMSYLLWGSTPDDTLLDLAEDGSLDTPEGRRDAARTMLDSDRGRAQVDRFHALWLGYAELPHPPDLTNAMRTETKAALDRIIFEDDTSWLGLFALDQTFVDDTLAQHYGWPAPGTADWIDLDGSGRQGILSHGSFLSVAANPDDTSPTKRGKLIRNRLLCQEVPPPPPDVPADSPPEEGNCKWDRYAAHRSEGSCRGCHEQMDPIGFGLENYDIAGRFRTHDEGAPECIIAGEGELVGIGTFNGPKELSDMLLDNGELDDCIVDQVYRYAMGHAIAPEDEPYTEDLATSFTDAEHRFRVLLMDLVSHEAFAFRMEE